MSAATPDLYVQEAIEAYIEAALWAGSDWRDETLSNPVPLEDNFSERDLSVEARAEIVREVSDFIEANDVLLTFLCAEDYGASQCGHDFYLTRNRHGAGFRDRGLGEAGDELTTAAHACGTSEFYPGDDGKLYVFSG